MPFPLTIGTVAVSTPPELAALVRSDAHTPALIPGKRPCDWLVDLVEAGELERELVVELAAALLQHPEAMSVTEGARVGAILGEAKLAELMLRALDGHDLALLLAPDPADLDSSVEDTVLRAAGRIVSAEDDAIRELLLTRLRYAGLPDVELAILCRWGSVHEMRVWLPAVLSESVGEAERLRLLTRIDDPDPAAVILRQTVERLRPDLLVAGEEDGR